MFTLGYWFSLFPPLLSVMGRNVLVGVFGTLIVAAVVLRFIVKKETSKKKSEQLELIMHWFNTIGLLGVVYTWLAVEGVYILGARFMLLALAILTVVWGWWVARQVAVVVPAKYAHIAAQEAKKQYLN